MTELTKYGTNTNYRVPPESTGGRIAHHEHWYFKITGLANNFSNPATYTLGSSGISGVVVSKDIYDGGHRLLVTADRDSPLMGFVLEETITIMDAFGSYTGVLRAWDAVLLPQTSIVDAKKPDRNLTISSLGAASVRFTEGEPTFDPYGLIRMSQLTRLADYVFRYSINSSNWQQSTSGTTSITHMSNISSIALDIGVGAGDRFAYTTNRAHRYTPGISHLATMSVHCGDELKVGCIRRWGIFNDSNGFFFEHDGDTLNAVIRTKASGVVVEERVPQNIWEVDRLDGAGGDANPSSMNIDVSKHNVYWIDFQWHGAGVVRFGTFTPEGKRIIAHVIQHANSQAGPYTETATLPFRISIQNTQITASPSRLSLTACALFREGPRILDAENNNAFVQSHTIVPKAVNGTEYVCLGALRAAGMYNGVQNHKAIIPRTLSYYCDKDTHILIRAGTQLDGTETWVSAGNSAAEISENPVPTSNGVQASGTYMNPGAHVQEVSEFFNSLGQNLHSMADATPGRIYTVWAKLMNPAETGTFHLTLDWVEI